jgi:uncharacterized SAM-binding protein YcdF (DUF218 family)
MKKFTWFIGGIIALIAAFIVAVSLYLPISNPLKKADAIIVVSGGDTRGRTLHGIDLYKKGWAPKLIFSGAAKDPSSASNAKAMLAIAAAQGVPQQDISLDESSRDTKENAQATKQIVGNDKTIILVTSDYHQRRVYAEFKKQYPASTEFINSPAKDKNWGRRSWFLTPYGWWISATEPIKLLYTKVHG